MTILIGKYEFDGPYKSASELEEKPGLFAILHIRNPEEYELIHLAESENIKDRIELSPTTDDSATGEIVLIAMYTGTAAARERKRIIAEIESEFENDYDDRDNEEPLLNLEMERFDLVEATK